MNRFFKTTLIIAGCLILTGTILLFIGRLGGGRYLSNDIVSGLSGFSDRFEHLTVSPWGIYFSDKKAENEGYSFDAKDVKGLDFELGYGEYTYAERADGADTIDISIEGKGDFECTLIEGTLRIKNKRSVPIVSFGVRNLDSMIEISVPKNFKPENAKIKIGAGEFRADEICSGNIDIKLGAGMMSAGMINAEGLELKMGAGQIDIDSLNAQNIALKVGAGEMNIGEIDTTVINVKGSAGSVAIKKINADSLDMDIAMGEFEIMDKAAVRKLTADLSAGQIDICLAGGEDDYNYDINVAEGEISIGDAEYSGLAHGKKIDNGALNDISLDCSAGEINIEFE